VAIGLLCIRLESHEKPVIKLDDQQLWWRHMQLAQIGGLPNGGVNRHALTTQEVEARRLIARWASELNCQLYVDAIANLFIRREGAHPTAAPVVVGSHIDTQPTGGKFDGTYGVLAGLQVLEALNKKQTSTHRPIEAAIWTNEDGCRFAPGMMGSEAFAGLRDLKDIMAVRDIDGLRVANVLPAVLAATPNAHKRALGFLVAAYIEPHIEQGPILEAANCVIGAVTGIQGTRRFRVEVVGEEAHVGTTPQGRRKDALSAAAHLSLSKRL
jgi:N-carbamoyl-L-amino-acid hydrolase